MKDASRGAKVNWKVKMKAKSEFVSLDRMQTTMRKKNSRAMKKVIVKVKVNLNRIKTSPKSEGVITWKI